MRTTLLPGLLDVARHNARARPRRAGAVRDRACVLSPRVAGRRRPAPRMAHTRT